MTAQNAEACACPRCRRHLPRELAAGGGAAAGVPGAAV